MIATPPIVPAPLPAIPPPATHSTQPPATILVVDDEPRLLDETPDFLRRHLGSCWLDLGKEHRKLFAADASEDVLLPETRLDHESELAEHAVAGDVPVAVVDLLEVIDVEEQERQRAVVAKASLVLALERFVEAARAFGERIVRDGGATFEDRLRFAYERAVSRLPSPAETALLRRLYHSRRARYLVDRPAAERLIRTGEAPVSSDLDAAELAAWTSVARAILNLHETITRG